jgi:hypothetical protein
LRAEEGDGAGRNSCRAHREPGTTEIVADIFEENSEAVGEPGGVFDGLGAIAEKSSHLRVALQMALGILGEEFAGGIEMSVFADAGENVEDLAPAGARVLDAVRGDDRQPKLFSQVAELLIDAIFASEEMPRQFRT